jgi:phage/plasmid-associated DNA primase
VFIRGKDANTRIHEYITALAEILVFYDAKGSKKHYALSISKMNMILEFIRTLTYCSMTEFDTDSTIVNLKNGLYHFNGTFGMVKNPAYDPTIPKNPENPHANPEWINGTVYFKGHQNDIIYLREYVYKSFIQFPIEYVKDTVPTVLDEFLSDVFGFDNVPLIYEMVGYVLFGHIKYQKAFILYGPPSSGKTTFINMLMRFLGGLTPQKIISQVRLQSLSARFQSVNLMNKVINIYDDLPTSKVGKSDMFRLVVTNETLGGEAKYTPTYLYWRNRCKLLFSCNTLPPVERTEGDQFWRRWILLSCFCEFKNRDKMTQEDEEDPNIKVKNPNILEEICTPQEFSGLLNKCLQAYGRLHERGNFPKEWDDVERLKGLWLIDINPVKLFLDECCEIVDGTRTDYYKFIDAVNEYRAQHNAKPISPTMVTQSLRRASPKVERSKDRKYYTNIKILYLDGNTEEAIPEGIDQYLEKLEIESKEIERVDYSDGDRIR